MFTHSLDPVLIDFGFIAIRWYSLAYIFGILFGWWYGRKLIENRFSIKSEKCFTGKNKSLAWAELTTTEHFSLAGQNAPFLRNSVARYIKCLIPKTEGLNFDGS